MCYSLSQNGSNPDVSVKIFYCCHKYDSSSHPYATHLIVPPYSSTTSLMIPGWPADEQRSDPKDTELFNHISMKVVTSMSSLVVCSDVSSMCCTRWFESDTKLMSLILLLLWGNIHTRQLCMGVLQSAVRTPSSLHARGRCPCFVAHLKIRRLLFQSQKLVLSRESPCKHPVRQRVMPTRKSHFWNSIAVMIVRATIFQFCAPDRSQKFSHQIQLTEKKNLHPYERASSRPFSFS